MCITGTALDRESALALAAREAHVGGVAQEGTVAECSTVRVSFEIPARAAAKACDVSNS